MPDILKHTHSANIHWGIVSDDRLQVWWSPTNTWLITNWRQQSDNEEMRLNFQASCVKSLSGSPCMFINIAYPTPVHGWQDHSLTVRHFISDTSVGLLRQHCHSRSALLGSTLFWQFQLHQATLVVSHRLTVLWLGLPCLFRLLLYVPFAFSVLFS